MRKSVFLSCCLAPLFCLAQQPPAVPAHADTLRGSLTPERTWWDIQRYDITIKPDFRTKTTAGDDLITYKVVSEAQPGMQIDLQAPLHIDSVLYNSSQPLSFTREGNAWHVKTPQQKTGEVNTVRVYFSGTPHESTRPPWSGGWTWTTDSLGRPWMTVTCQGMGASLWYPCKDHQSDEPDEGASLTIIAPDTLVAVSNGRLQFKKDNGDGTTTTKWAVVNPISNYCLIPYIGKYAHFHEDFSGEKGHLDLDYWVLDYNLGKAKSYLPEQVHNMLHSHEHWFGPYPFYEDGYKLVDVQHPGMEHQSAVAYGNHYAYGYRGRDASGTGIGMKWDFIVVHESGHEWFGNNLTSKDLADMYVHEGYTNYSETLFVEYMYGKDAGNAYNYGIRRGIRNDRPIIPRYNINEEGSGDMYPKAGNMLHSIRHSMDDDSLFRQILRGMNRDFYHQTVTTQQIEHYLSAHAGFDYQKVFDQYLRTTQIPDFEYYFSDDHQKVYYRYSNCVAGFDLPLVLGQGQTRIRILPTDQWQSSVLKGAQAALFAEEGIKKMYYIGVKPAAAPRAPQAQRGGGVKWTKDGKGYYAVESNSLVRYDLPAFQRVVIADDKQLTPAGQSQPISIQAFSCSDDEKKWLLYTNTKKVWRLNTRGDYWVLDLTAHTLTPLGLGRPPSSLMFAKLSPDGTRAAYSSEHNVYVEDLASGTITPLTKDGAARMINGTFDWAYEEEFSCRDGFRWSPDSKSIAYWQIDATGIRNFLLIDNTDSLYSFTVPVEYPKAGEDPSACRVGVVDIATGQTIWMQVPGDSRQHYIPRMEWADNSSELVLEQLNRKQNDAKVFICNAVTGAVTPVYEETDNAWIDVKHRWSDDPTGWEWMSGGKDFLWVSEKDGWRHLYRISRDGKKETLLTKGNYDLITIRSIDEKTGYVYFMASPDNATQQYLYRISLDGKGKLELVSPSAESGTHSYNISPGALYATHNFSNHLYESVSEWVSLSGHKTIKTNDPAAGRAGGGRTQYPVKMFRLTTDDSVVMDGWMILPKNFDSTKKYPVLFYVYTEPAAATVRDAAGSAGTPLYAGDIAADGYIQISLDGRGTPVPKGAAWRKCIYRKIGIINIRDQAMAARKILQWPFVDTSRIAVHGWSGGGSATLNLMFQYPDIYKTGIAIAPVANELLYDNIYQERYMGLPQENRDDFVKGSPIYYAKNLRGNLLVVHGTGDDNVHYQGTEMLINELVKYDKKFQVMVYPNRTHAIREGEGTSLHLSHLFTDYLKEHCPGGGR